MGGLHLGFRKKIRSLADRVAERISIRAWQRLPAARRAELARSLMKLNEVLAHTPLAGRYWVWGGMLLGWAREGRLLAGDCDVDFGLFREDLPNFWQSAGIVEKAGFRLNRALTNSSGELTEFIFLRRYLKYEFFVVDRLPEAYQYWTYYPPKRLEMRCSIPAFKLAPFELFDRIWPKPEDHDVHLTAVYGNWRLPDPDYWYVDNERSIVERTEWRGRVVWAPTSPEISR
jgi:hypothetical protein